MLDEGRSEEQVSDADLEGEWDGELVCVPLTAPIMHGVAQRLDVEAQDGGSGELVVCAEVGADVWMGSGEEGGMETRDETWGSEVGVVVVHGAVGEIGA